MSRLCWWPFTVRLGFVFAAIALPGLFVTIVKRLIGRARPFIGGEADPFLYMPFAWRPEYASLPSGHATNVFAALVAIGLVWPRLRAVMLVYALIIAVSRLIVLRAPSERCHRRRDGRRPSARSWCAIGSRRAGWASRSMRDGGVRALPGPSLRRLKAVARRFAAA